MILTAYEIEKQVEAGRIHIDPFNKDQLQINSYDIRLGGKFIEYEEPHDRIAWGVTNPRSIELEVKEGDNLVIKRNRLYLAHTMESVGSDYYVPMLEGRSSMGRTGCFIHITAGFGDIGFKGSWTLELFSIYDIVLTVGMRIGQVYFNNVDGARSHYVGMYAGQTGPKRTKLFESPNLKRIK